jgi:hypothetical protein
VETTLYDAAFRLISHSQVSIDTHLRAPVTDEDLHAALRSQFPGAGPDMIGQAIVAARELEGSAIEMARSRHPELTPETLAERCPGFSGPSYAWAVNDGFILTRK